MNYLHIEVKLGVNQPRIWDILNRSKLSIFSVPRYPHGHFVKSLGPIGEKEAETESLLLEHEVIHRPFSEKILAILPDASWHLTEKDISDRVDLRHLSVFSIDPPGNDMILF